MATVNAPYPSTMEEIDNASVVSMVREGNDVTLLNRGGDVVATFQVQSKEGLSYGSLVTTGSFDSAYRDEVVKDWYRPLSPNAKLANPATLPTGQGLDVDWSPDGVYLAVAHQVTPYVTIYKRSGDVLTKLANPATLPTGNAHAVSWSPDGQYLAVCHQNAPFLSVYKRAGDVLTKIADSSDWPTATAYDVSWVDTADGVYLAIAISSAPRFRVYKQSGDVFTKIADPLSYPTFGGGQEVAWSPEGKYLALGTSGSPFAFIYKREEDILTRLLDFVGIPGGGSGVSALSWSPDAQYLAMTHGNSADGTAGAYLAIFKRAGDTFVKLPLLPYVYTFYPLTFMADVNWSPDGKYLVIAYPATPFIDVFKRDGDEFTRIDYPSTLPTGLGRSVKWSPNGQHLAVAHDVSPYITVYKSAMGPLSGPAALVEIAP